MDKETKVLDYHDVLLYRTDIDLLTGDKWLNDQIVSFFFEYLQLEKYARLKDIFFCGGSLSFLLLHGDPLDLEAMVAPLKLRERELVLFACNDNPDPSSAGGGSHWSLLTYTKQDSTFRHYNSAMGLNEEAATGLATNAWNLLGSGGKLKYRNVYIPRQINSYDCGLYMLGTADIIAESYSQGLQGADVVVGTRLTPDAVHKMRSHILDLIMERAGKVSKPQSSKLNSHELDVKH
ncbi:g7897 [Coccomyxa elongata]